MLGDCRRCGHSIAYHLPFAGCLKCSCDEFAAWLRIRAVRKLLPLFAVFGLGDR